MLFGKEIKKYDNLIYKKYSDGYEYWRKCDENNNCIHYKASNGYEYWKKYDEFSNLIHYKDSYSIKYWWKYDENNEPMEITEKEYKDIEFRKKEKEYNSRTKCSRFELMEI